ncbi:TIR domain-containing protein [Nannocystis pusilla]|uniref:TIR domain-containing protein n=1 Tax=Nannocystis pusilla TaxID=889268 RepID=A0A9X3EUL2_9BACT|nr:TIR domain-containing protein [Nannocystis pusilla]
MPRVFISYSHDSEPHREAVLALAQQLRRWGLDVHLDRFVPAPLEGWPRWMMTQVESADFVLIICTATYRRRFEGQEAVGVGKGVTFEGLLATQYLYDASTRNTRFIPVLFEGTPEADIPIVLRPYQRYTLPPDAEAYPEKLEQLVRHLMGLPEIVAAPLGPLKMLPLRDAKTPPTSAAPVTSTPAAVTTVRTALAPATIHSTGAADVRIEPNELLHRLLLSLFPTGDDFRGWVSLGPDGSSLVAHFPGGVASAAHVIAGGVEVLRRRGYLDAEFFTRLRSDFSRHRDDVERAAMACGAPLSAMITPTLAPVETSVTTSHGGLHPASRIPSAHPDELIQTLAEAYPDVRDARAVWVRAGGKASDVENIARPRDLWQRLWLQSRQGAAVRPAALLRAALDDLPNNTVLLEHIERVELGSP